MESGGKDLCPSSFSPNDITSISNNTITGLLIDSDNRLWAYTWGVGINELNLNIPNNRTFKRYTRENIPELEGDFINSACEDVINHGIWFGSTRGVHFYDKRKILSSVYYSISRIMSSKRFTPC